MFDYETIESKFRFLRKRCQDIKIENRKVLEAVNKPKIYQITVNDNRSNENKINYTNTQDSTKNDHEILKLLNMTLRDIEKKYGVNMYNNKKEESVISIQGDKLAKYTYEKELKAISKIKYQRKDDMNNIDVIVEHLNQTSKKKYMIKKKQINELNYGSGSNNSSSDNDGYINIKNKQFNDKLQREKKQKMDKH